jgi:FtsP/CotA-like multicopper oxidase with cupredoxin domain
VIVAFLVTGSLSALAQPVPGGTLDPTTIPKYVTPLVIPPVMNNDGAADSYDISVREFHQQILPGGIWKTLNPAIPVDLPATKVWSYGPAADDTPVVAPDPNTQFNYPAYTIETTSNTTVDVRWINDLVDPDTGDCLEHILPLDQTLHWANPPATGCREGDPNRTDCATNRTGQYTGPVPIVTHVHGAHVEPHSDGYPEAWWLPVCNDVDDYATSGSLFDDATGMNDGAQGYADYEYIQTQPAATLWYHDHSLGMTRSNVYAGPAGFWLVRGGAYDTVIDGKKGTPAVLPGPAPVAGDTVLELNVPGDPVRGAIREIPIVIQDRSFNADGSLFYPDNRAFFEALNVEGTAGTPAAQFPGSPELQIDFVPDSDIAPIWNPEAFFNTMVVNGVSWPKLEVAPARYRFRLLNGCNSRFLNLALVGGTPADPFELPFIQIGAEQGFLPVTAEILTGFATPLPGDGTKPKPGNSMGKSGKLTRVPAPDPQQALLMGLAERADVIVDFSDLPNGTVITMINTAPDAPFGGFPDVPADPGTSGQVMQFVVNNALLLPSDAMTTNPYRLQPVAEGALGGASVTREVSLNEGESEEVCVDVDMAGNTVQVAGTPPACPGMSAPFGPKEALLGVLDGSGNGVPLKWTDHSGESTLVPVTMADGTTVNMIPVTENPTVGATETWEMFNFTADAHPIHLHLVRFEVLGREAIGGGPSIVGNAPQPWESGFKDTVISYPGEITRIKATFDIEGLYVWHCHIVEHEDNEMMRPYVVSAPN